MQHKLSIIRKIIRKQNLDAVLISSVSHITYLTGYASFSATEREAYLLITHKKAYIFTDLRYSEAIKQSVAHMSLKEITSATPLVSHLQEIIQDESLKKIGFEADNLTVSEYTKLHALPLTLSPCSLSNLRSIKDKSEIEKIAKACSIGDKAFDFIQTKIKKGITERDLAFELEIFIKKKGADLSFPSIIAFGINSAIPHHATSDQQLRPKDDHPLDEKTNNFVLLDFGVKYKNYCSDMTRTIFYGNATDTQKKMYQTVLDAQQKSIQLLESLILNAESKQQIIASEVDLAARNYILSQGYSAIPHSVGHGIGLEVHEHPHIGPTSKDILTEGMVFSIEPGIYKAGYGGVRIEDLFVIQNNKLRQITNSPKNLIEIS